MITLSVDIAYCGTLVRADLVEAYVENVVRRDRPITAGMSNAAKPIGEDIDACRHDAGPRQRKRHLRNVSDCVAPFISAARAMDPSREDDRRHDEHHRLRPSINPMPRIVAGSNGAWRGKTDISLIDDADARVQQKIHPRRRKTPGSGCRSSSS